MAGWVDDLQVPKVLVATQTRVGEAAVDEVGTWVPSVPTIAVVAPAERLWAVAAVDLLAGRHRARRPTGPPAPP